MTLSTVNFAGGWVDLTPGRPLPLAGYETRQCDGRVIEPLEANVVLMESGPGCRVVFVQLDVLSAGMGLRQRILDRLRGRLKDEELFLVASHSHFAPNIDERLGEMAAIDQDYVRFVGDRIVAIVERILTAKPRAVALEYGEGSAAHSMNRRQWCWRLSRRWPFVRQVMGLHPNPKGPRDELVRVVRAVEPNASALPVGILWNYACHAVTCGGFRSYSSDYPGVVRRLLRERYGNDLPVVFLPGFGGDVRPNLIRRWPLSPYYLLHRIVNGPVFARFDPKTSRQWSSSLAGVVSAILNERMHPLEVSAIRGGRSARPFRELLEGRLDERPLGLQVVKLEPELSFLGIAAEPVSEYGFALQEALRPRAIVPVGYLDGVCGYLPTSEMVPQGGLEVESPGYGLNGARFRPDVSALVVERVLALDRSASQAASQPA